MSIQQQLETITRPSLHMELVERIRLLIMEGDLPSGSKVPEKDLCTQFGVSRTPMREALKVLAVEGLISLEPNRGAWVSTLTIEELKQVFPVMGALEALSGELACAHITDEQYEQIVAIHDEMLGYYKDRNLGEYFRTNQAIHALILEAACNETLSMQYRGLASRVRRARYVANMSDERWAQAVNEHEEMIEALKLRDGKALAEVLKRHMENKFETVRQWVLAQEQKG